MHSAPSAPCAAAQGMGRRSGAPRHPGFLRRRRTGRAGRRPRRGRQTRRHRSGRPPEQPRGVPGSESIPATPSPSNLPRIRRRRSRVRLRRSPLTFPKASPKSTCASSRPARPPSCTFTPESDTASGLRPTSLPAGEWPVRLREWLGARGFLVAPPSGK